MSRIEDEVCKKIQQRAEVGKNKYGVTMERGDLSLVEWLTHLQEELMDATVYVQRLIEETSVLISSAVNESIVHRGRKKSGRNMWTQDSWRELVNLRVQYPEANSTQLAVMMDMSVTGVYQCVLLMDARVALGKDPIPPTPLNGKGEPCTRKRWTQEEKEEVRMLLKQGITPISVAAMLDAPKLSSILVWKGEWGL